MSLPTKNLEQFYMSRPVADLEELKAIPSLDLVIGLFCNVADIIVPDGGNGGRFIFDYRSTLVPDDINVIRPSDVPKYGRWIRDTFTGTEIDTSGNIRAPYNKGFKTNLLPTDATFCATYAQNINATAGLGVLTGTVVGDAKITDGWLDLTAGDDAVYYAGSNNIAFINGKQGTIKFKYKPNYSGAPSTIRDLFSIMKSEAEDHVNLIEFSHNPDQPALELTIYDNTGTQLFAQDYPWSPVAGTEYEMNIQLDLENGNTILRINGVSQGTPAAATGTLGVMGRFDVGGYFYSTDGFIKDFVVYGTMQEQEDYTPGYALETYAAVINPGDSSLNDLDVKGTLTVNGQPVADSSIIDNGTNIVPTNIRGFEAKYNQKMAIESEIAGATFGVSFREGINGDYGAGTLTGTASGGAAVVDGWLDLAHNDVRYVTYSAVQNADSANMGCIRFDYKPNYTGNPATPQYIASLVQAIGNPNNAFELMHLDNGYLYLNGFSYTGALVIQDLVGLVSFVAGQTYHIELDFNVIAGQTRVFVNGTQIGITITSTYVRAPGTIQYLRIGAGLYIATDATNFSMRNLAYFPTPQHLADYTSSVPTSIFAPNTYISDDFSELTETEIHGNATVDANKQHAVAPVGSFYATFRSSINANYTVGNNLVPISEGGAAIASEWLDLAHDDNRFLRWAGLGFVPLRLQGAVKFKIKFNYSGAPANYKPWFSVSKQFNSAVNLLTLEHKPTGHIGLYVLDSAAGTIIDSNAFGTFTQTAGVEYEILLNLDLINGYTTVFIDGNQNGAVINTISSARDTDINALAVGTAISYPSYNSNVSIRDFVIYDQPQTTAAYTPGYTLPEQPVKISNSTASLQNAFIGGNLARPLNSNVIAYAGGGQTNATHVDADYSIISTCATAADSIKLMPMLGNLSHVKTVINQGAAACSVWPILNGYMNGAQNSAYSLASGDTMSFLQINPNSWITL